MKKNLQIAVVIPTYKASSTILDVVGSIPPYVTHVFVIDDACPEGSGKLVEEKVSDSRVRVLFNETTRGVGGAVIRGYEAALKDTKCEVFVKLDSDGQMDPSKIGLLLTPILRGKADYTKGNRFDSLEDLEQMPRIRILGNAGLSLMSKISSGYWDVNDPTNGFTAISRAALSRIALDKVRRSYFFESDMLFRLSVIRAVVKDVPMQAIYGSERSNLQLGRVLREFPVRHFINTMKRIFYNYYLREWNAASLELPTGLILIIFGGIYGAITWATLGAIGVPATAGQTLISAVPVILGFQLFLSFLNYDIASVPKDVMPATDD